MHRLAMGAFAGFALLTGCLGEKTRQCKNGATCPYDQDCTEISLTSGDPLCASERVTEGCENKLNFTPCTFLPGQDGGVPDIEGACYGFQCVRCSYEVTGCDYPGWNPMFSQVGDRLRSLWVPRLGEAYAVGDNRTVLAYSGIAWNKYTLDGTSIVADASLTGVWGDASKLFVTSGDGKVLEGQYAGGLFTWTDAWSGSPLNGIGASGPNDVVAVGFGGTLVHYDGTAWNQITVSGATVPLRAVWVADAQNAWAVGNQGLILRRKAGMWSISQMNVIGEKNLNGVWGTADEAFVASDYSGMGGRVRLLHFKDGDSDSGNSVPVLDNTSRFMISRASSRSEVVH